MELFDFNHDGEVSDLERIIGLAAVLSETNPDVEISVNVGEDEDYESMTANSSQTARPFRRNGALIPMQTA